MPLKPTISNTSIICLIIFLLSPILNASQDSNTLDPKSKEEIVNKVASIMKEKYVFPKVGEKMASHIKTLHSKGAYNSFTKIKPFCSKMTKDLRSICNDKHLWVFYSPEETREVKAYKNMLPKEEIKKIEDEFLQMEKRENFGFHKLEILEGNVGYLDLRYFSNPDKSAEVTIAAMKFLSNSDAIILDLRNNGGGESNNLLISYFFSSKKVHLGSGTFRDSTLNEETWTMSYVPGKRMPDTDLYILISPRTFSAAEFLAYSLKHLKRAVIIGENSKGGAHPVDVLIVKGNILTQIAIGNSYNPITKTNWEGVGVVPDIKVKSEHALDTAHRVAIEKIMKKTSHKAYKDELNMVLNRLKKKQSTSKKK